MEELGTRLFWFQDKEGVPKDQWLQPCIEALNEPLRDCRHLMRAALEENNPAMRAALVDRILAINVSIERKAKFLGIGLPEMKAASEKHEFDEKYPKSAMAVAKEQAKLLEKREKQEEGFRSRYLKPIISNHRNCVAYLIAMLPELKKKDEIANDGDEAFLNLVEDALGSHPNANRKWVVETPVHPDEEDLPTPDEE